MRGLGTVRIVFLEVSKHGWKGYEKAGLAGFPISFLLSHFLFIGESVGDQGSLNHFALASPSENIGQTSDIWKISHVKEQYFPNDMVCIVFLHIEVYENEDDPKTYQWLISAVWSPEQTE